jgi:hypothetical protein
MRQHRRAGFVLTARSPRRVRKSTVGRRRLAAAGGVLLLLVLTSVLLWHRAGGAGVPRPTLQFETLPGRTIVESTRGWKAGESASTGALVFCVESAGSAQITSIAPEAPHGGIRIVQWGVRSNPSSYHSFQLGGPYRGNLNAVTQPGGIASGLFTIDGPVTSVCGTNGGYGQELGLTYVKPGNGDAATGGLLIRYTAGAGSGTIQVPVDEVLCGLDPTVAPLTAPCPR